MKQTEKKIVKTGLAKALAAKKLGKPRRFEYVEKGHERLEKPSLYIKKRLEKVKKELLSLVKDAYGVNEEEARTITETEEGFQEILKFENRYWTIRSLRELMPELFLVSKKKAQSGWTANAKDAVVAMGILQEKAIFDQVGKQTLNIGGKNIQINLGFGFKPYKEKREGKELKA